jgi:hypothetical protein
MKKNVLFAIVFAFLFAPSILNLDSINAKDTSSRSLRGNTEVIQETEECFSGYRYMCGGVGDLCDITTWICYQFRTNQ